MVVLLISRWLTLGVGEEGVVPPHLGLEQSQHHDTQERAQADAGPHGITAVARPVLDLVDHGLVLGLLLHLLGILLQGVCGFIITTTIRS